MDRSVSIPDALQMVVQLRNAGRPKKAAQICARILHVDQANADALFHLGCIEMQIGSPSRAVEYLSKAVAQHENNVVGVYTLGCAQEAANQTRAAIASYRRAISLDGEFGGAYHSLASTLFRAGRLDEALESSRRALELGPNVDEARHLCAQILQQLGDFDGACSCHQDALAAGAAVRRCQVIQAVIARRRAQTYLEIGVDTGDNLRFVHVSNRLAVDPIPPSPVVASLVEGGNLRYFEMTSDRFFADHSDLFDELPLEVAFVDGLHTHAQAFADVENCLELIGEGGVVLMHDCNPTTEAMAIPAESYEKATQVRSPDENTDWTGDVWKAVVRLRSQRSDISTCVLDCDYGIGIVVKRAPSECIDLGQRTIEELTYQDLEANRERYLGLRPPRELWQALEG